MDGRLPALVDQLLLVERELRLLGWWSRVPPSAEALASRQPFCVDTLQFHEWLQWIFLPRMKQIVERGEALPAVSGIREMAEVCYRQSRPEVARLLDALGEFDRLISESAT